MTIPNPHIPRIPRIHPVSGQVLDQPVAVPATTEQRDQVLDFLLHRMSMDTRRELMAALPVAYVALFPSARDAVTQVVFDTLNGMSG